MKKFNAIRLLFSFFTLSVIFILTSCLPDTSDQSSFLQIGVEIEGIDSTLTAGNDSLMVDRVLMLHGRSFFVIDEDSTIELTGQIEPLSYESDSQEILGIYNSIFPEGVYEALTFKIVPATEDIPRFPEFTEGGEFSIIVDGTYNDTSFTFKSEREFTYPFQFIPPVSVSETLERFLFIISANTASWFKKRGESGYYNPLQAANDSLINENIEQSFTIEQLQP